MVIERETDTNQNKKTKPATSATLWGSKLLAGVNKNRPPRVSKARVIVTILGDIEPQVLRRTPAADIAGKGKTLGDLVSPMIEEQDWECLK